MTNKEFFDALGNPNPICLVNNNKRIDVSDIPKYIDNYDIFFIPNIGGTKNIDITDFKCFFVDFDCGRDKDDKFYPLNYVKKFKDSKLQDLKKFEIQPNAIVETRNGLHAYWFIREEIMYKKWNFIEKALIRHFNTDKTVCSPAHQLRLPNSTWFKDKANPFKCSILYFDNSYTYIETYCDVFNWSKKQIFQKTESKTRSDYNTNYKPSAPQKQPLIRLNSYKELFDHLTKKVSMFDYLKQFYGLEGENQDSFCCLFHNDEHPSASIFKTDSGIELYYCRTNTCNFIGNIIQVVGKLKSVSRSVAINILCQDLNIEYKEDIEAIKFLLDNIRSIDDDIELSHRDLYGVIYRYIPTLKEIHSIALRNIIHSNYDSELVFSTSVGYVAKALSRSDKKSTCADINLFCLLNLLTKLDLEEKDVADKYKKYITRTQRKDSPHINLLSIPAYTYDKLSECNEMAKMIKSKNLRKKDFSYESVSNAFGTEIANKVFPQFKNKPVKTIDNYLLHTIEYLLEKDGYFTQNTVYQYYIDNGKFFKEKTYIRQLPAIMQLLDLEKVKASKKIKEEYKILSAGFPYLFRKKS